MQIIGGNLRIVAHWWALHESHLLGLGTALWNISILECGMKLVKFRSTEIPEKVRTLFRDEQARSGSKYIPILVWRINSVEQMAWLMCQGVDGGLGKNVVPHIIYVHCSCRSLHRWAAPSFNDGSTLGTWGHCLLPSHVRLHSVTIPFWRTNWLESHSGILCCLALTMRTHESQGRGVPSLAYLGTLRWVLSDFAWPRQYNWIKLTGVLGLDWYDSGWWSLLKTVFDAVCCWCWGKLWR